MQNLGNIQNPKDLITKEWLQDNHSTLSVMSKTYTGVYCKNTDYPYYLFMRIIPDDATIMWHVKYRVFCYTPNSQNVRGEYWCEYYGYNRTPTGYKMWNSRRDYPFYYHCLFTANNDARALTYGNFAGIYLNSGNSGNNSNYGRTFIVDVESYSGCTIELFPTMQSYYYDTTEFSGLDSAKITNIASNYWNINGTTNGLQESSDSDSYYLGYYNGIRPYIGLSRLSRYTLCGWTKDGRIQQFSFYGASYSTSIADKASGTRTYQAVGFDYTKGICYYSTSTAYNPGAVLTSNSLYFYQAGIDFRWTDNCVASSTANTLGMQWNKPVYFRGVLRNGGLFYIVPLEVTYNGKTYQRAWTQDIPTQDDGYLYWFIGFPYDDSNYRNSQYIITLSFENKLYRCFHGVFQEYIPKAYTKKSSVKDNPIVVAKNIDLVSWKPNIQYCCNQKRKFSFSIKVRKMLDISDNSESILIPKEIGQKLQNKKIHVSLPDCRTFTVYANKIFSFSSRDPYYKITLLNTWKSAITEMCSEVVEFDNICFHFALSSSELFDSHSNILYKTYDAIAGGYVLKGRFVPNSTNVSKSLFAIQNNIPVYTKQLLLLDYNFKAWKITDTLKLYTYIRLKLNEYDSYLLLNRRRVVRYTAIHYGLPTSRSVRFRRVRNIKSDNPRRLGTFRLYMKSKKGKFLSIHYSEFLMRH